MKIMRVIVFLIRRYINLPLKFVSHINDILLFMCLIACFILIYVNIYFLSQVVFYTMIQWDSRHEVSGFGRLSFDKKLCNNYFYGHFYNQNPLQKRDCEKINERYFLRLSSPLKIDN